MDTKEIWQKAISELEHINRTLDRFLKIAQRSRRNKDHRVGSETDVNEHNGDNDTENVSAIPSLWPTDHSVGAKYKRRFRLFQWWKPIIEIFTFFFVVAYATITYLQWHDSAANFKLAQRPWVGQKFSTSMKDEPIISDVGPNQTYKWSYVIKNYGNSPALHTRGHARTYILAAGWDHWQTLKDDLENLYLPPNTENTIFNGGELPDSGISNTPLSIQQSIDIEDGKSSIVLGGRIEYFDQAGKVHNTTWCIIYIPDPVGTPHVDRWHTCPINPIAD